MVTDSISLAESLLSAARRFTRASLTGSNALAQGELSRSEWHLMYLLKHWPDKNGARPSSLAQSQRVTAGNVAQQLSHLEEQGLVVRKPDKADRRVVLVRLTARGRKKLMQVQKEFLDQFTQLTRHLGAQDSRELVRLLHAAADGLEKKEPVSC